MIRRFNVTVDGTTYTVEVEEVGGDGGGAEARALPSAPAAASAQTAPAGGGSADVTSPLAGTVVEVPVKVGDTVTAGQTVLVLEAMKMNTAIAADRAGKVTAVAVAVGASVSEGQFLVSIG